MSELAVIGNTGGGQRVALPAIIAGAGQGAKKRFLEFSTVNIRNPNTRTAYHRAAVEFLEWCEAREIGRGPRHSISKGVTPVLSSEETTALLNGMNVSTVVG